MSESPESQEAGAGGPSEAQAVRAGGPARPAAAGAGGPVGARLAAGRDEAGRLPGGDEAAMLPGRDEAATLPRLVQRVKPLPRLSWRANWGLLALGGAVVALLSATYKHLEVVLSDGTRPLVLPVIEELTGAAGALLLIPFVVGVARSWPLLGPRGWRWLPLHVAAMLAFAAALTTWLWASRAAIFPLLGFGAYDYGDMPLRYLMELPKQAIIFGLILVLTTLLDRQEAARERELRLSRTEAALARAELGALHDQLRPHFLFNALNAISSTMYEDVERADRMLGLLSDLLRWSLRASSADVVGLDAELDATRKYLELMQARMGPRLEVSITVDRAAASARVPALVLQPLVENAATHGMPDPPALGRIDVSVVRDGDVLVLRVTDNGPGVSVEVGSSRGRALRAGGGTGAGTGAGTGGGSGDMSRGGTAVGAVPGGVGLANTTARLRAMYGDDARLTLRPQTGGGSVAEVRIPFRVDAPTSDAVEERWTPSG